jgi:hypothetical protein
VSDGVKLKCLISCESSCAPCVWSQLPQWGGDSRTHRLCRCWLCSSHPHAWPDPASCPDLCSCALCVHMSATPHMPSPHRSL